MSGDELFRVSRTRVRTEDCCDRKGSTSPAARVACGRKGGLSYHSNKWFPTTTGITILTHTASPGRNSTTISTKSTCIGKTVVPKGVAPSDAVVDIPILPQALGPNSRVAGRPIGKIAKSIFDEPKAPRFLSPKLPKGMQQHRVAPVLRSLCYFPVVLYTFVVSLLCSAFAFFRERFSDNAGRHRHQKRATPFAPLKGGAVLVRQVADLFGLQSRRGLHAGRMAFLARLQAKSNSCTNQPPECERE